MEKKKLEDYLKRLQELDSELNENSDPDELMAEINKVINGLSKDVELDNKNKALFATLKFVNKSNNPDPSFAHKGDRGFDIRANLKKDIIINEGSVRSIPTDLYFELDEGLEVQIRTRTGMAGNSNIWVLNSPGTINSQYRGQIQVILANFDNIPHKIKNGDRIAQGVVCPVYGEGKLIMEKVEKLSETTRDDDGLGSGSFD
jgi:dUTP pyrophosphatase